MFFSSIPSISSWSVSTFDGASAIKSCAFAVFGNAITSRIDFSPASSATTRSMPSAMPPCGRRSVGQRVEKKSETAAQLLLAEAQRLEHALLHVLLMNSNAAGAQFDAVQNQVVAFRTHREAHFVGSVFELRNVFLDDSREGMLRADDALVGRTPFK